MANTSQSLRIDDALYQDAKRTAPTQSRTTAQQVTHWARIGRELEASRAITSNRIADVLAGRLHYDEIDVYEQAAVRAAWDESIDAAIDDLDLAAQFAEEGRTWVEADPAGNVVHRGSPTAS
jgi:hypothetical protein